MAQMYWTQTWDIFGYFLWYNKKQVDMWQTETQSVSSE